MLFRIKRAVSDVFTMTWKTHHRFHCAVIKGEIVRATAVDNEQFPGDILSTANRRFLRTFGSYFRRQNVQFCIVMSVYNMGQCQSLDLLQSYILCKV